jgi:hypothetical protein
MQLIYRKTGHDFRPGLSLVVVVSLIGLLSVLAISVLTMVSLTRQTNHLETESRKCEMLAESSFNVTLSDLIDEIKNGAASVTETTLDGGTKLRRYDFTGKPEGLRVGQAVKSSTFADTSLMKQSASGVPFHTQGGQPSERASSVSTAAGSDPLAPSLWAKPRLLPPSVTLDRDNSPDWIYVNRRGDNPVAFSADLKQRNAGGDPNPKFVIGRYAYNLYETSGLLDINAAGHPSGTPDSERVGDKGSLAMADLAGLPGMSAAAVDKLVSWKHDWAIKPEGALIGEESSQAYVRLSEGSGWKNVAGNDNLFLNRQDLLRYSDLRPQDLPDATLPILTHFSRDLDAPSYRPNPDRPSIENNSIKGGNDAFSSDKGIYDKVNPDMMAISEARKGYLLPRRFPLERLKYVATPGQNGPLDAAKAEKYFGLRWTNGFWTYTQARANGDLYTLEDVPADREPNFFEILRATVLCGSLGRQYGATGLFVGQDLQEWSHKLGGIDGSINLNILEMGACIIDQADADSFPTAISLGGSSRDYWAFGKEDVPYLYRTMALPYRTPTKLRSRAYNKNATTGAITVAKTEVYEVAMVLQSTLWRPHQITKNYQGPVNFRIRPQHIDVIGGGSMFYLQGGWPMPGKGDPPFPPAVQAGDYSWWGDASMNYRAKNPELFPKTFTGAESIELSIPYNSNAFREPQTLHSPEHASANNYSVGNAASGSTSNRVRPGDLRWPGLPTSYDEVYGFLVGKGITARIENDPLFATSTGNRLGDGFFRGDPLEFMMEYQAEDGSWRPYQRAEFTYFNTLSRHYQNEPYWDTAAWAWTSFLIDPRTARFGGIGGTHQAWSQASNPAGEPPTGPTTFSPRLHWPEGAAMRWEKQQTDPGVPTYAGVWSWWRQPAPNTGWNFNAAIVWDMNINHAGCLENDQKAWEQPYTLAYKDPDGVLRPGVGAENIWGKTKSSFGNPMSRRYKINLSTGALSESEPLTGRPRVLNRMFRSVGELAYCFRGTPWRDIDFLHGCSPDAGLLDVFSLYENPDETLADAKETPVVAGRVNLNSASKDVLAALLRGTAIDENKYIDPSLATKLANEIHEWLHSNAPGKGPLASKASIVAPAIPNADATTKSLVYQVSNLLTDEDMRSVNDRREFVLRALSDGTTVRSANFLLDLVVQTGQLNSNASSLEQFQSSAERHFWVHFAIDRPTGKVIDVQWEPVVE